MIGSGNSIGQNLSPVGKGNAQMALTGGISGLSSLLKGGNGVNPAAIAQQQAAQAQDLTNTNVNSINSAFSSRAPQYAQFLASTQGLYKQQLDQQNAIASRNLKFALARGGQTGGSLAADQGAELGREQAQGTLQGQQKAEGALSGLESQDQSQRLQLISEAQSGANTGTGAALAAQAMQANLGAANANTSANQLGDVFGGITNSVNQIQNQQNVLKGLNAAQKYANPFSSTSSGTYTTGSGL